jgi:DNA mismatch repair protein MSH5
LLTALDEVIEQRYDGVEMFLRSEFQAFTGALVTQIEKIGRIDWILVRMSKCLTTGKDFTTLLRSLSAALMIFHTLEADFIPSLNSMIHNAKNDKEFLDDITKLQRYLQFLKSIHKNCNKQSLRDVHHRITSIVDHEAITEERESNIPVRMGFHEELDYAKEKYDSLDKILSSAAKQVLLEHSKLNNLTAVFLHQLGFLIVLNKQQHGYDENTDSFVDLPPEFHCVFTNTKEAYFKTALMKELDDTIGDVHGFILDTERMIITELEEDILDHEHELRTTFQAISEMDCILCLAACADDLNFVRPKLVEPRERCIIIKNGRHPLQEAIIEGTYVPNDTFLDSRNRVNIITGPNFSGKSCYTRQIGVIVYMAQIGSFVPADEATISITDQILARIATEETCAVPQSSFQLEMSQMAGILRNATAFSLVLIDEFGKGTSPTSGIAVLTAVLKHLAILKCKVICTTHFLEIFSMNLVCDGVAAMKAFQMQVEFPNGKDDQAKPLFKLLPGVAKASAGIACAENAGLNEEIVSRAGEILVAIQSGTPIHPNHEICNPPLVLSGDAKEALEIFFNVENWRDASDESLRRLVHHLARM